MSAVGRFITQSVLIQNEQASPFGAGWTLQGLGRLQLQANGVAVVTEGDGGAVVFDRPAPGTFSASQLLPVEQGSLLPVLTGDYNEDGHLDLAVPYRVVNAGSIQTFFGTSTGTFKRRKGVRNLFS